MGLYTNTFETFDKNFIGFATLAILGQSCIGGAAAMSVLTNGTSIGQMIQLSIIVLICMITNTSILAQMRHKVIFNLVVSSTITSILIIALNAL